MLRLEFNDFQNKIKEDEIVNHYATIHCMVNDEGFIFVMKSMEKWNYYSIVTFDIINRYAQENNIDPIDSLDMFMTNYCSNTLSILQSEKVVVEEIVGEIEKLSLPYSEAQNNQLKSSLQTNPNENLIEPGDDLILNSKDYSEFLFNFFTDLEKKVLSRINVISDELNKSNINKTFGEFMRNLFNIVNTVAFAKVVKRYIKADLIAGLSSAENELNLDIGFNDQFQEKLNQLASQQIDGYLINGKKWPGIKGVTKEIQSEIIMTVQNGINENLDLEKIKENIRKAFDGFTDWRSEMIARTETTRITNEGKLLGYKESGLKGKKVWSTAIDSRTSPICRRLNNQEVELDENFIDSETNKAYLYPPAHPNCRSTIFFKPN